MATANTITSYGSITRAFHWATALLILTAMPLGVIANGLPFDTDAELARKALLFSVHKTIGVTAFLVALARILWAVTQTKPAPVHPDQKLQTWAAETAHWLLYASMVIVPLSGWLHHAATTGFAPIWWPFGQTLPFVPESEPVAKFFGAWHWVFTKVLLAAVALHILGALKHAVIDRDGVLARMVSGAPAGPDAHHGERAPFLSAAAVVLAAVAAGSLLGWPKETATGEALAEVESEWQVQDGTLSIEVKQLASPVAGTFADWTADIAFDPDAASDIKGSVEVVIAIGSLTIGAVTDQAMTPDFFDAAGFPTARFVADLMAGEAGYVAEGTLSLKGRDVPVTLPFELSIDGDTATMTGAVTLDRRDFGIGESYQDEGSVGFPVGVSVALTATRG